MVSLSDAVQECLEDSINIVSVRDTVVEHCEHYEIQY
jgi:hypothetical protein